MEQFNNQYEEEVKEKSVYLVHLDNARILILVSVFVAIIALSFLIGMKFSGASHDLMLDQKDVVESQIQSQEDDDIDSLLSKDNSLDSLDEELMKEDEIVAPEKAENIVPEKKKDKPAAATKTTRNTSKPKEKKNVVAVSVDTEKKVEQQPETRVSTKGFSIQIASFDSRAKAVRESDSINQMNYDSYIATARVNGKEYYRVKIGPFTNKTEAFATLDNLHNTTRYKDSYITFEK